MEQASAPNRTQRGLAWRLDEGNIRALATLLTIGILIAGFSTFAAYKILYKPDAIAVDPHLTPFWGKGELNAYFAKYVDMYDSTGQRLAVRVDILLLSMTLLAAPYIRRLQSLLTETFWNRTVVVATTCTTLIYLAYSWRARSAERLPGAIAGLLGTLAIAAIAFYTRQRFINRTALIVLVLLILIASMPAFVTTPDLSDMNTPEVMFVEHHFSVVLGQAERLAAGQKLGELVLPTYGLLLHGALAAFQRYVRTLDLREIILVIQLLQFLYLILCAIILTRHSRKHYLLSLAVMLFIIPWYHFSHRAILYPNQSSWRTIAFPIALLLAQLMYRRSVALSALAFGFAASLLLLLNIESGIAATAGLLACLVYRSGFFTSERRLRGLLHVTAFVPGIIASLILFLSTWRLFFGYWPEFGVARDVAARLAFWSSAGFAGLRYFGDLMPAMLVAGAIFVLIYYAFRGRFQSSPANCVRIASAAIAIAWIPYYANRADFWNLSSFCLLYGIGAIDALRCLAAGVRFRRFTNFATVSAFGITALVTVPFIHDTIRHNLEYSPISQDLAWPTPRVAEGSATTAELSGVILRKDVAKEFEAKAETLKRIGNTEPLIFLTLHSYLIPKLSGRYSQIPVGDLVGELLKKSDYEHLIHHVKNSTAREIYVDPTDERDAAGNLYLEFYGMLLHDLEETYRFDRTVEGWQVWVRKVNAAGRE